MSESIFSPERWHDTGLQYQVQADWKPGGKKSVLDARKINRNVRITLPKDSKENFYFYSNIVTSILEQTRGNEEALIGKKIIGNQSQVKWVVVKKTNLFKRLGKIFAFIGLTKMIHTIQSPAVSEYELKFASRKDRKKWKAYLEVKKFENKVERIEPESAETRYAKDSDFKNALTDLATYAYEKLEPDFIGHDKAGYAGAITSNYLIILDQDTEGSFLKLVPKKDKEKYKEQALAAVNHCKSFYTEEYGKKKVDIAQHLGHFSLDQMQESFSQDNWQGITPDHIYRMNIALLSCTSQELDDIVVKLAYFSQYYDEDLNLLESLEEFQKNSGILSNREARQILNHLGKKTEKEIHELKVSDLKKTYPYLPQNSPSLKLEFTRLVLLNCPKTYTSFEQFLNDQKALIGIWSPAQINALEKLVGLLTKSPPGTADFLSAMQFLSYSRQRITEIPSFKMKTTVTEQIVDAHPELKVEDITLGACLDQIFEEQNLSTRNFLKITAAPTERFQSREHDELIRLIKPSEIEKKRAYTGREIKKAIGGSYKLAGKKFLKYWVDLQEFSQAESQLENDTLLDPYTGQSRSLTQKEKHKRFNEFAAFILCKKHLFKSDNNIGFSIGELVPAPSREDGSKRWYRVDKVIAAHEGLMCFHLVPLGEDSGLSSITVDRSTSASKYAFEASGTVQNDLNRLNGPGREGKRYMRKYVNPINFSHSIPTWVGYQYAAGKILNKELANDAELYQAAQYLERSTAELKDDILFQNRQRNLHELVGEYSAELNNICRQKALKNLPKGLSRKKLQRILRKNMDSSSDPVQDLKDASFILRYISFLKEKNGSIPKKHQDLVNALGDHVFRDNEGKLIQEYQSALQQTGYELTRGGWQYHLQQAQNEAATILAQVDTMALAFSQSSKANKKAWLKEWEACLHHYANSLGENVEAKQRNGLNKLGHSLGGAAAAEEIINMTMQSHRIPVPDTSLEATLYYAPGLTTEENLNFQQYILQHRELLAAVGSKIKIHHVHDFGDIVPLGSQAHLGAFTPEVATLILKMMYEQLDHLDTQSRFITWAKHKKVNPSLIHDREKLFKSELGKKLVLEFTLSELRDVLSVTAVVKKPSENVLEPATAESRISHSTQYDTSATKLQKEGILDVVKKVASEKKKKLSPKYLGVLQNYFEYYFPHNQKQITELEEFKNRYHGDLDGRAIASMPALCVQLKARAQQAALEKQTPFLQELNALLAQPEILHELSLNPNDTEATRFLALRMETRNGKILSAEEKLEYKELSQTYQTTLTLANKLAKQEEILTLWGSQMKGNDEIPTNFAQLKIKKYRSFLLGLKQMYEDDLNQELKQVGVRCLGGVQERYLSESELGKLTDHSYSKDPTIQQAWGTGAINSKRATSLMNFLAPKIARRASFNEINRKKELKSAGHGKTLDYRDDNGVFVVDSHYGALRSA